MGESERHPRRDGTRLERRVSTSTSLAIRCLSRGEFVGADGLRIGWSLDMQDEGLFRVFEYGAM